MGGEKMVEKWMQVLDLSVCGVKEKNWKVFAWVHCWIIGTQNNNYKTIDLCNNLQIRALNE
jgi:hypothetical protein